MLDDLKATPEQFGTTSCLSRDDLVAQRRASMLDRLGNRNLDVSEREIFAIYVRGASHQASAQGA